MARGYKAIDIPCRCAKGLLLFHSSSSFLCLVVIVFCFIPPVLDCIDTKYGAADKTYQVEMSNFGHMYVACYGHGTLFINRLFDSLQTTILCRSGIVQDNKGKFWEGLS
jgi:hypothetical protein